MGMHEGLEGVWATWGGEGRGGEVAWEDGAHGGSEGSGA